MCVHTPTNTFQNIKHWVKFCCIHNANITDLASDEGVKNLIWVDSDQLLYEHFWCLPVVRRKAVVEPVGPTGFQPETFRKFLALYLHGAVWAKDHSEAWSSLCPSPPEDPGAWVVPGACSEPGAPLAGGLADNKEPFRCTGASACEGAVTHRGK